MGNCLLSTPQSVSAFQQIDLLGWVSIRLGRIGAGTSYGYSYLFDPKGDTPTNSRRPCATMLALARTDSPATFAAAAVATVTADAGSTTLAQWPRHAAQTPQR